MLNPYLFVYRDDSLASSMVIMRSMVSMRSEQPTKVVVLLWSSVACFGVKVSVTFHLTCVSISFSSVWVAEWPPFGKELLTRFTICLVPLYLAEVIWVLIAQVPGHCIRVFFKYSKKEITYGYFVSVFQSFRLSVS